MKANIKYLIVTAVIGIVTITGCKKDFFNRTPLDNITVDNFYQTNEEVAASTNNLYNSLWFNYVGKAGWAVCEMTSGNGRSYSADVVDFGQFTVFNNNAQNVAAWASLWTVVEQANALINIFAG